MRALAAATLAAAPVVCGSGPAGPATLVTAVRVLDLVRPSRVPGVAHGQDFDRERREQLRALGYVE